MQLNVFVAVFQQHIVQIFVQRLLRLGAIGEFSAARIVQNGIPAFRLADGTGGVLRAHFLPWPDVVADAQFRCQRVHRGEPFRHILTRFTQPERHIQLLCSLQERFIAVDVRQTGVAMEMDQHLLIKLFIKDFRAGGPVVSLNGEEVLLINLADLVDRLAVEPAQFVQQIGSVLLPFAYGRAQRLVEQIVAADYPAVGIALRQLFPQRDALAEAVLVGE